MSAPARTGATRRGLSVRFVDVYKVYRIGDTGVLGLGGVDVSIEPGAVVALVGPSGSGKSTALHLMGGLDRASAGTVEVGGVDLGMLDGDQLAAFRADSVGFVWQGAARNLLPYLSALDNVRLVRTGRRDASTRSGNPALDPEELLALVGLEARRDHVPAELSGGEQQRVAVAVAVASDPPLLLADEPTAELDVASATAVLEVFHAVADRTGATVVISTHDPRAARRADRRFHLRHGRLADLGTPIPPLRADGSAVLPPIAASVLGSDELEVSVGLDDVVLRPRREGRHG